MLKSAEWWGQIREMMGAICDAQGLLRYRLHGLRILDPAVFTQLPLASGDSTNAARNNPAQPLRLVRTPHGRPARRRDCRSYRGP